MKGDNSLVPRLQDAIAKVAASLAETPIEKADVSGVEGLIAAAQHTDSLFCHVVANSSDLIATVTPDGNIGSVNPAFEALLGYPAADLIGRPFHSLTEPADEAATAGAVAMAFQRQSNLSLTNQIVRKGGPALRVEWMLAPVGAEGSFFLIGRDLSAQRQDDRRIHDSEQRFKTLVEHNPDAVYSLDRNGQFVQANRACERLSGQRIEDLLGRPFISLVVAEEVPSVLLNLQRALQGEPQYYEVTITRPDGHRLRLDVTNIPMIAGLDVVGVYAVAKDVTLREQVDEKLAYLNSHDSLTRLPNRSSFITMTEKALTRTLDDHSYVAVMFLDLDGFKVVNDSLGYHAGDLLLLAAARRLVGSLRSDDTVARICGDEFSVMLQNVNSVDEAIQFAERILRAFASPFVIDGQETIVTPSVGVVLGNYEQSPNQLLRSAVVAMYEAKSRGKATYVIFDPSMNTLAMERLKLESELRRAIERKEFSLYYQPVVGLQISRIIGMEALVRWKHPQRGIVPPLEFIPLAEETGLILPLGQWILREACLQMRRWQEQYPNNSPLFVSVNLSVRQVQQPTLAEDVRQILAETGLTPDCLQLEITESVMMKNDEATIVTLRDLKELGVKLAIDDFGTGYSSLRYLKHLPIDTLKIDRSFVGGLGRDPKDTAIVRTVITFAKALNLIVNGEGIETVQQLAHLLSMGCDIGQGFYFRKPLTTEGIGELLAANARW